MYRIASMVKKKRTGLAGVAANPLDTYQHALVHLVQFGKSQGGRHARVYRELQDQVDWDALVMHTGNIKHVSAL